MRGSWLASSQCQLVSGSFFVIFAGASPVFIDLCRGLYP